MPPRGRNKSSHDRQSNAQGLAPPGKRIQKQKSTTSLNGHHANGHPPASSPPLSTGKVDLSDQAHSTSDAYANGTPPDIDMERCQPRAGARGRTPTSTSLDETDAYTVGNGHSKPASPAAPLRIDVAAASVKSSSSAAYGNPLALAATILASCPLRDVIAILIILLQLPSTLLTTINFLFAALDFIPAQAGTSLSALPSLLDMFQGSAGAASISTVIFMDILGLWAWLFAPIPLRNVVIDLAQAVIAISLGGAAAGNDGTWKSVFLCTFLVSVHSVFRWKDARQWTFNKLWAILFRTGMQSSRIAPTVPDYPDTYHLPRGTVHSLIGVHVLCQGVVKLVRRYMMHRQSEYVPPFSSSSKGDPEAASASLTPRTPAISDNNASTTSSSSTDGRPPGPSPAARDSKDRVSSSKRRKKQARSIRSEQPFWAAIAQTKVSYNKATEQKEASIDAFDASASDIFHIGNATFRSEEEDRVWIEEVGSTEIKFGISLSRYSAQSTAETEEHASATGMRIDTSKPFYVRINGADWGSTRIQDVTDSGDEDFDWWSGEIFGLTALSNYRCEFIRLSDQQVIYSSSLITQPAPFTEQTSVVSTPTRPTLRPSSPTTTLKNSISAAESKLQEFRNRVKRNRKDHKSTLTSVKKEVDTLNHRLSSSGGNDDRQRQRARQLEQHIRQAEDGFSQLSEQISNLGDIPDSQLQEASAVKSIWQQESKRQSSLRNELESCKAYADREVGHVEAEISTAVQKRERLQTRLTKLNEQHDRLVAANAQSHDARERKVVDREMRNQKFAVFQRNFTNQITQTENQMQEVNARTMQAVQQIEALQNMYPEQYRYLVSHPNAHNVQPSVLSPSQQSSVPTTPEGPLPGTSFPGTAGNRNSYPSAAFSSFQFPGPSSSPFAYSGLYATAGGSTPASLYRESRGRSSSMLSGVSGFTDDIEDVTTPGAGPLGGTTGDYGVSPTAHSANPVALNGVIGSGPTRKDSGGSASGSLNDSGSGSASGAGSTPGSQRDPTSPSPRASILAKNLLLGSKTVRISPPPGLGKKNAAAK